jgi:hypothetical protein
LSLVAERLIGSVGKHDQCANAVAPVHEVRPIFVSTVSASSSGMKGASINANSCDAAKSPDVACPWVADVVLQISERLMPYMMHDGRESASSLRNEHAFLQKTMKYLCLLLREAKMPVRCATKILFLKIP